MTTNYKIILLLVALFSCRQAQEKFDLPNNNDINSIVETIINSDSLPVYKNPNLKDTIIIGQIHQVGQFVLLVDTNLIKLYVFNGDSLHHKQFTHFGQISNFIRADIKGKNYFSLADSTYLMYQNDSFDHFSLSSEKFSNLSTCDHRPKTKCMCCLKLSIPIFSRNKDLAYIEMFSSNGHNAYLLKKNGDKWTIIERIGISIYWHNFVSQPTYNSIVAQCGRTCKAFANFRLFPRQKFSFCKRLKNICIFKLTFRQTVFH